jgi:polyhydroxyalkanoate synthesis repressor PhaR
MAEGEVRKDPIIIKKYANRRLYNTSSSSYITLDDLARMTRDGVDFQVLDAKTGGDITHAILTQIIMEEETHGEQMLPVSFLRQLISMYGNSMQSMMPPYLEATMQNFRDNQLKLQDAFKTSLGPDAFAKLAETNMAMFKAATQAFIPGTGGAVQRAPSARPADPDEIAKLRSEMAEMQRKIDKLSN